MNNFSEREALCTYRFENVGECWHLWTPENSEVIFRHDDDFEAGMNIFAICARLNPLVKIFTFELMSNHIHLALAGDESMCMNLFHMFKKYLRRYLLGTGRGECLKTFVPGIRKLESLSELRNVITYINRNGYLVRPEYTPFTYPWGANCCFFNDYYKQLFNNSNDFMTVRERQNTAHTHEANNILPIKKINGFASPLGFCVINESENIFRDSSHYFYCISKNIEADKKIAADIGESIFYTDDELFAAITSLSNNTYGMSTKLLSKTAKIDLAKVMKYEYNAGNKQICRILKLEIGFVNSMFPSIIK